MPILSQVARAERSQSGNRRWQDWTRKVGSCELPGLSLTPLINPLTVPTRLALSLYILPDRPTPPPRPHVPTLVLLNRQIRRKTRVELRISAMDCGEKHKVEQQEDFITEGRTGVALQSGFQVTGIEGLDGKGTLAPVLISPRDGFERPEICVRP